MKMRHLLVPVVALALSASAALAQSAPPPVGPPPGQGQGPGGGGRGARRMQTLLQGITLAPAQQSSIDSITTAFQGRMPAFTPGVPPDSAAMAQRRALTTERDAAVRAILTPDQQHTWDTNMQTMQANTPPRPGN